MKKRGLLCFLTAGILALSACGASEAKKEVTPMTDEVVMTIDGEDVMKSEYMVYLYSTTMNFLSLGGEEIWTMDFEGQTGDELVAERTLHTLQSVLATKKYAAENNIVLTEEELAAATKSAGEFVTSLSPEVGAKIGMDQEKMTPCMEETQIFNKVYQALAAEAEVNEAEKQPYFEENKVALKEDYTMLDVSTVVVKDMETATLFIEKYNSGTSFEELFAEYEIDEAERAKEEGGKTTMFKRQYKSSFGTDVVPAIGTISEPIPNQNAYMMLLVTGETAPTEEEVRTISDQGFTAIKQDEYAAARMEEMIAAQTVSFVDEVFKNLEKFH